MAKTDWKFNDVVTEADLNALGGEVNAASAHAAVVEGAHGATSAASPGKLMQRDSAGRVKVAAPAAADDAARKAEVDAVQSSLTAHASSQASHVSTADRAKWNGGAGSGLNADMVDGYHFDQDVRKSAIPSFDSINTTQGTSSGGNVHLAMKNNGNIYGGIGLDGASSAGNGGGNLSFWTYDNNGAFITKGLDIARSTGNVTIPKKLNLGGGSNSNFNLADSPIYFRGQNATDGKHYAVYENIGSTDGIRMVGNNTIRLGTFYDTINWTPILTLSGPSASNGTAVQIERHGHAKAANSAPAFPPAGITPASSIVNWQDHPAAVGLIVASRYMADSNAILDVGTVGGGVWQPFFKVTGLGNARVSGTLAVGFNGGSGRNNMNSQAALDLSIGDHDTGLLWNGDNSISMYAAGQQSAYWDALGVRVQKSFSVAGTKSAVVSTSTYGDQYLFAIESPENRFEDYGEAMTDQEGQVIVSMDPIFLETVEIKGEDYHVFIQSIDEGAFYVPERYTDRFMVKGKPNSRFMYRIAAWRRGYHSLRFNHAQGF
ncbi:hypothetical protein [Paenibacillus sp. B01]|uniref:hypothetical protein n=1 Tax=Paenibacillus sp. B01 TaxID=2660554 RepID=UPI00129BD7E7|nr:hypothetical protein [Paenibacillus sp. B01]QGG57406.1 hypothetical protein GE073_18595 [Paenibacillus sp. B01]